MFWPTYAIHVRDDSAKSRPQIRLRQDCRGSLRGESLDRSRMPRQTAILRLLVCETQKEAESARQPVRLGQIKRGRIRGLKMHVVFDQKADCPSILDITDANVNDAQIGDRAWGDPGLRRGRLYIFDICRNTKTSKIS